MEHQQTREIEKSLWLPFFDSISANLRGKAADISLVSSNAQAHQSTLWQLNGVTYDPYDDAVIVSCRQQEHVISAPSAIRVEQNGSNIESVEITKSIGEREVIRFIDPLLLSKT